MSYAIGLDDKRRAALLSAGKLAPDLPIGSKSIGYYDRANDCWSDPTTPDAANAALVKNDT